jgi:hypothetical protein
MTKEQKLTKWVQAGIDGGAVKKIINQNAGTVIFSSFTISGNPDYEFRLRFNYLHQLSIINTQRKTCIRSINDLILNKPFMRSVYGEGYVCEWCDSEDKLKNKCLADLKVEQNKLNECTHLKDGKDKTKCPCYIIAHEYEGQPAYLYHAHKALDIIYEGGDPVEYLCQSMEG